jgi:pimeloyl-ACP methyl ester carboxylesterase
MGGLVAVRVALAAPERVLGLLLLSPAGAPMEERQIAAIRDHFALQTNREAHAFLDKLLGVPSRLRWLMALGLPARLARPAIRAILDGLSGDELLTPAEVQGLAMPVFFFWGARDRILDADQLAWYLAHLPPHAVVELPEGFGHSPFFDHPGRFVGAVRRFVDGVAAAGSRES